MFLNLRVLFLHYYVQTAYRELVQNPESVIDGAIRLLSRLCRGIYRQQQCRSATTTLH